MSRLPLALAALAVAALFLWNGPAFAQTKLEVSHFPGGGTWPVLAAKQQGYFAKEKLDIHLDPITGSVAQIKGTMDGSYDIALTALDNVIAYDAGQGQVPLDRPPDLFAFMGGQGGAMYVVTAPAIKRIEDLNGKTLAVDAKNTGFAFVLYRIAALHGLKDGDYSVLPVGSSQKRLDALTGGQAQAALLNPPFDKFAVAKGFNALVDTRKVFPHYQASVGAARRSWAAQHKAALVGFIRAYVRGSLWLFDRTHKAAAIDLLLKNTPNLSPAQAATIYADTTADRNGNAATAKLDPAGVATVVKLRNDYGEPKKTLAARDFYDLTYYKAATK